MTAEDPRIERLVDELLNSDLTPEQVCAETPELLPAVRRRLRKIRRLGADLDSLFPIQGEGHAGEPEPPKIPGYEVQAVLGRGGIGIIFRVRHVKLDRVVALKMLLSGEYAGAVELARFAREAQSIAALQHPNIVQIYEVGQVDGRAYFTMELVGGGSLSQKLGGIPQPAQYGASVIHILARAIHAAHLAGIIHRDLKPANILLTPVGTPKISDFGLARHFEGQSDVTLDMAKIGTPSYMAPEQVTGKPGEVGPPADIYALGATLYELLTGRPPFRGETATETERQLLTREPVRPSQLNAKVPRDLETICLKCLQKEPTRRYESAAALADDLRRFEEGRPIQARPVGWAERSWRWCRRNPTMAALLVTALTLVGMASGGGTRLLQQRSQHNKELRSEIGTAVTQAVSFRKGLHFQEARERLEEARQRLEPAGPDDLRRRVAQCRADLNLVEQLDAARSQGAIIVGGKLNPTRSEPFYASAFAQAGLGQPGDDSATVAARVQHSSVCAEIVDALDDWASISTDPDRRKWLFEIARQADPDPQRNLLRQPELWDGAGGVAQPIPQLEADKISPRMATALARLMQARGLQGIPLLAAVQARVPQDFWLNFELNNVLFRAHRQEEALGYARAALALRPRSGLAHSALGAVLLEMGRVDEAMDSCRKAVDIDPTFAEAQYNLGEALRSQGKPDEAIGHLREAIAINPKATEAYIALGVTLQSRNRLDEAVNLFKEAIRLDPRNAVAHNNFATILRLQDRLDDAIAQFQEAVNIDPRYAIGQMNLGAALWVKGRLEEAIEHIQQAARLDLPDADAQRFLCEHLYGAARAAVLETLGHRVGKPMLDETARANLRLRALDWSRASLKLGIKLVNNGQGQASSLATWQTEPALAIVREPGELAKLPDAERGQWQRFWADVAAEIATDPVRQFREGAAQRDWAGAASAYARRLERGPMNDGQFWFEYAAVQLLSGDRPGYRAACMQLIERCGKPGGARAYHVARAGTLAAAAADGAPADATLFARLAQSELRQNAKQFWSLTEQGALAYRAGRFEESVPLFEQSLKADAHPGRAVVNWAWLALAQQRLGKTEEAQRWLAKTQTWLDQYRDGIPPSAEAELGLHLHNWLEANVLRREAEAMIPSATSTAPNP
ncbi:MAG: tetratricopeptide repeat protein kinase family protein [Phycisphaerales bacterium]|nr:tetratricopeptide repeat protein kinase family protein [Phycisphaerales bacterium]